MYPGRWLIASALVLSPLSAWAAEEPDPPSGAAPESSAQPPVDGAQPAPEAAPEAPPPASTGVDHREQLDGFSNKLDGLETKIALVSSRVDLLRDVVLGDKIARSRATIVHRNDMGSAFVLERATYILDGGVIFAKDDPSGGLDDQRELVIFDGGLDPGEHEISVSLTFGGSSFGFFTYLKGYKFKVESRYRFMVADGKLTKLNVVSFAKDDITQQTGEKIAVRYDIEVGSVPLSSQPGESAAPATTPAPTPTEGTP